MFFHVTGTAIHTLSYNSIFRLNAFIMWNLCRRMFGDECLGALNIEMVEVARRVRAASKFTGSGGAVVAFCPEGPPQVKRLEDECRKAGFSIQAIQVVPSCLNDEDLKTLSK